MRTCRSGHHLLPSPVDSALRQSTDTQTGRSNEDIGGGGSYNQPRNTDFDNQVRAPGVQERPPFLAKHQIAFVRKLVGV